MQLKFVRYYDEFSNNFFTAYFHHSDSDYYHFVLPLAYGWLSETHSLHIVDEMKHHRLPKSYISIVDTNDTKGPPKVPDWLLSLSISAEDFNEVSLFFEHYLYHEKKGYLEALELTVSHNKRTFSRESLTRCVTHVINAFSPKSDRLRLLFHPFLSDYYVQEK
jgi:hypothetical protein